MVDERSESWVIRQVVRRKKQPCESIGRDSFCKQLRLVATKVGYDCFVNWWAVQTTFLGVSRGAISIKLEGIRVTRYYLYFSLFFCFSFCCFFKIHLSLVISVLYFLMNDTHAVLLGFSNVRNEKEGMYTSKQWLRRIITIRASFEKLYPSFLAVTLCTILYPRSLVERRHACFWTNDFL